MNSNLSEHFPPPSRLPVPLDPVTGSAVPPAILPHEITDEDGVHELPLLLVVKGLRRDQREYHKLVIGSNLADCLMQAGPDRWGNSGICVYRNCLSRHTQIALDDVPDITVEIGDLFIAYVGAAEVSASGIIAAVLIGGAAAILGGPLIGLAIGATVLGGYAIGTALFQPPQIRTPESAGDQGSGRGTLGIPKNQARLGSRIPDIFGYMRTWPDLIAPALDYYNGEDFSLDIYYCLGMGDYDFTQQRFGDTPIENFIGRDGKSAVTTTYIGSTSVPFNYPILFTSDQASGFQLEIGAGFSAWVVLPGTNMTQIWIDIAFPGGLIQYRTGGDPDFQRADFEYQYSRVNSDGSFGGTVSGTFFFRAKVNGSLRYTHTITGLSSGQYRVRVRKTSTTTTSNNIHVHDAEVARFASYKNGQVQHRLFNTGRSYMRVQVSSSRQVGAQSFEDFNLIVSRYMYVLTSAASFPTTAGATRRWCDAMFLMLVDSYTGNYLFSEIDVQELLDTQAKLNALGGGQDGQFNHIFDRFTDVDEQLQATANAVRCSMVQDYGRATVVRDEIKPSVSAMITPHNRSRSDEGQKTITFQQPDENDGVEITWFDRDNDFVQRVYRYPSNVTLLNPRKVEVVGLTIFSQVHRRAKFESLKQTRRRRTNTVTTFEEGLLLLPMDLVEITELWDTMRTAEIVGYNLGTGAPFSAYIIVQPKIDVNANDVMTVSSRDGRQVERVNINAAIDQATDTIFIQNPFTIEVGGPGQIATLGGMQQIGSRVAIYPSSRHDGNLWLVQTVKPSEGKVSVTLVEYDTGVYAGDTDPVPTNQPPRN